MPIISGGGGGAAFNGGTITEGLRIADPDGAEDQLTIAGTGTGAANLINASAVHTAHTLDSDGNWSLSSDDALTATMFGTGTASADFSVTDARASHATLHMNSFSGLTLAQTGTGSNAVIEINDSNGNTVFGAGPFYGGIRTFPANPATKTLSSGTGAQIDAARDKHTVTPVTLNPGVATTATCAVAISPDDVTYTTLWTETVPAGTALDGTIHGIYAYVPAGWFLKLTVNAQATIGTTTYY